MPQGFNTQKKRLGKSDGTLFWGIVRTVYLIEINGMHH